jgi:hypothetical protein
VEASPTGAGLVTDTLPAGKSPRGPGLASLPGWDDRIPRNAKIRVALSAFAPLPRLRPFPPSSPLFQCRKGAGFCQRPESGRQSARGGAASKPSATAVLRAARLGMETEREAPVRIGRRAAAVRGWIGEASRKQAGNHGRGCGFPLMMAWGT